MQRIGEELRIQETRQWVICTPDRRNGLDERAGAEYRCIRRGEDVVHILSGWPPSGGIMVRPHLIPVAGESERSCGHGNGRRPPVPARDVEPGGDCCR